MDTNTTTRHTWEFGTDEVPRLRLQARAHHTDVFVRHAAAAGQTKARRCRARAVMRAGGRWSARAGSRWGRW